MNSKSWYHDNPDSCCEMEEIDCCDESIPKKLYSYPNSSFKDRLLCLLGDDVLFSVDARICRRESFCGTLCYVGCDFIIVNVSLRHKPLSMHIPIDMIRFIAPYRS